jgi:hypothetical protein
LFSVRFGEAPLGIGVARMFAHGASNQNEHPSINYVL